MTSTIVRIGGRTRFGRVRLSPFFRLMLAAASGVAVLGMSAAVVAAVMVNAAQQPSPVRERRVVEVAAAKPEPEPTPVEIATVEIPTVEIPTVEARELDTQSFDYLQRDAVIEQVLEERDVAALDRDQAIAERDRALEERDAALAADREMLIDLHARTSRTIAEIERILAATGIDASRVTKVSDASDKGRPRGGPFVPWSERAVRDSGSASADRLASLTWGVTRLQALRDLLAHMPLASPLPQIDVFGGFGYRHDPFTGHAAMHEGMDLRGDLTTPVFATAGGTVVFAGWYGDYGNMVDIDHGYGFTTRYAHLSKILVKTGAPIVLQEQVGVVGATGRVTALHLHYEVRVDGRPRNPVNFLKAGQHVPKADHAIAEEISFAPDAFSGFDRRQGAFDFGNTLDRQR
jgi:murein DD-endopeptidase MepM/ murein hydrolase activator NlpD